MPTFGHIFFGLCLLIPILYYTRDKFNYKVALIFLANNIYGPDIVFLFIGTPFHSILGFLIIAIPLALFYSYFSRFSLIKSDKKFPLKFVDDGIREVNWKNSYCITAAGGFSHFFIDQFFHWEKEMTLWPGITFTQDDMLAWSGSAYHTLSPLILIGDVFIISTIILSLYFFKKGYKNTFKFFLIITGIAIFLMLGISTTVFTGEREYAVIVAIFMYIFLPLFLLMYAARDISEHPKQTPEVPKIKRKNLLFIVSLISIFFGLFIILYAYLMTSNVHAVAKYISTSGTSKNEDVIIAIRFLALVYTVLSVILIISSIGLFFKLNFCRYIVIIVCLYFFIFAFPLAIALFLCEKDVKKLFGKETEN
jgi:hypothetical protein